MSVMLFFRIGGIYMKKLLIKYIIIALIFCVGISIASSIGLLRLDAYPALNSPVTVTAQAAALEESSANKVVIYVMDVYKVKVDGKESEIIPNHGEYVIRALEEGKVLANNGENPEIIRVDFGTELVDSKGGYKGFEFSGAYFAGLMNISEYAKSNPGKKIIVLIGSQHVDQNAREQELFKELAAQGIIIVAGAGNDNSNNLSYPGAYPEVINVASIEGKGYIGYSEDEKVKKAGYSNYGKNVYITADGSIELTKRVNNVDTVYRRQATEIAAARVARLIAQMFMENSALTAKDVIKIIRQTADPIEGIEAGDDYYGQGLLGAGVVSYKKSLNRPEPNVTDQESVPPEEAKGTPGFGIAEVAISITAWLIVLRKMIKNRRG